ncbi:hypothetical protein [Nostoc sp.]
MIDPEILAINVENIKEMIADSDWVAIHELERNWKPKFRAAVWKYLSPEDRKIVKQLKADALSSSSDTPPTDNLPDPALSPSSITPTQSYDEAPVFEEPEVEDQELVTDAKSLGNNQNYCQKLCESAGGDFTSVEYSKPETESVLSDTSAGESTVPEAPVIIQLVSLRDLENSGYDVAHYAGDRVEVRHRNDSFKFTGTIIECNVRNAFIKVMTEEGIQGADFRDAYVIPRPELL